MRYVVAIGATAAMLIAGCSTATTGHGHVEATPTRLSHVAVERFIERELGVAYVTCNYGRDVLMHHNGQTFTCRVTNRTLTVRIDNVRTGSYTVK